MRSDVHIGSASTLIILSCIQNRIDHCFSVNIVLAKVHAGISTLKFLFCGGNIQICMNGIQVIIGPDRSDLIRIDLTLITIITTVPQHHRNSQLFIEHQAVDVIQILYIIEIRDIDNVIAMQSILHINGLRIGGSAYQLEISGLLLLFSFLVAPGAKCINTANIGLAGSDSGNRALMYFLHHISNPALVIGNEFRSPRTHFLIFREQTRHISVAGLNKSAADSIMLKTVLLRIKLKRCLESTNLAGLRRLDDVFLCGMRQKATGFVFLIVVKHIMLHLGISSFRIVIIFIFRLIGFPNSLSDHCINHIFLLFIEGIKYLLNCLVNFLRFFFRSLIFLRFGFLLRLLFLGFVILLGGMINHNVLVISNNGTVF